MSNLTEIPKLKHDGTGPGWIAIKEHGASVPSKPLIKCRCGHVSRIGLHHVHADGTVTASFFHDAAPHPDIG